MPRRASATGQRVNGAGWLPKNLSVAKLQESLIAGKKAPLAKLASIVRFRKGTTIYRAGAAADTFYIIISGTVAAFQYAREKKHIAAFLYAGDLFGAADQGRYSIATMALTPVVAYAVPSSVLRMPLPEIADLHFYLVAKICDQLHQARHHALILAQLHSHTKVAMFLQMQKTLQALRGDRSAEIHLSMTRSNIAEYIGISLAALSRAFGTLKRRRIITYRGRRSVQIINAKAFQKLAGEPKSGTRFSVMPWQRPDLGRALRH
jgi:CRP-like cAMP-binding protein